MHQCGGLASVIGTIRLGCCSTTWRIARPRSLVNCWREFSVAPSWRALRGGPGRGFRRGRSVRGGSASLLGAGSGAKARHSHGVRGRGEIGQPPFEHRGARGKSSSSGAPGRARVTSGGRTTANDGPARASTDLIGAGSSDEPGRRAGAVRNAASASRIGGYPVGKSGRRARCGWQQHDESEPPMASTEHNNSCPTHACVATAQGKPGRRFESLVSP